MEKLFLEYKDLPAFRLSLQDFLVQIKVLYCCKHLNRLSASNCVLNLIYDVLFLQVYGEDDVYLNEERLELEREKETRQSKLAAIPGMVGPNEMRDQMAD